MVAQRRVQRMQQVLADRLGHVRCAVEHLYHRHNASAILRTCDALGIHHVHLVGDQHFNPSQGASRGAWHWLDLHRHRDVGEAIAAIHEAGHMVVGATCGLGLPERAALTIDGGSVEYPRPRIETRQSAQARLTTLLAGYAAEQLVFGEPSSGAGNGPGSDLARATDLARRMLFEWGMGDTLTHLPASGALVWPGDAVDHAVQDVLGKCLEQAQGILRQDRDRLTAVAELLLTERELSKERCIEVFAQKDEVIDQFDN